MAECGEQKITCLCEYRERERARKRARGTRPTDNHSTVYRCIVTNNKYVTVEFMVAAPDPANAIIMAGHKLLEYIDGRVAVLVVVEWNG